MVSFVSRLTRQPAARLVAAAIVLAAVLLAVIGPYLTPFNPERPTSAVLLPPSLFHPLGTDASGIDVLSIVLAAFRVDVVIAVVSVGISALAGISLGAACGYGFNGSRLSLWGSTVILRFLDLVQSIPVFVLALALVGMVGQNVRDVVIAVAFVNLPVFARLTRASVRSVEQREFVAASRSIGVHEMRILGSHVLPNSLDSALAYASVAVGGAILLTAGLSFLGAGVRPPTPEWGAEIASGAGYIITGQWWISVVPGLVLSAVVLSFALLGDAVRLALGQPASAVAAVGERDPRAQAN